MMARQFHHCRKYTNNKEGEESLPMYKDRLPETIYMDVLHVLLYHFILVYQTETKISHAQNYYKLRFSQKLLF